MLSTFIAIFSKRLPCSMKFSREFNFADFSSFAGTNFREFGFRTLFLEIIFRGFHARYLKVTKNGWSFSLHCLQPISLNFSPVNKKSKLSRIFFFGGSLFSRDLISRIDEKSAKFAKIKSHEEFMPHACYAIHRRKKDGGCTFYQNTLRT